MNTRLKLEIDSNKFNTRLLFILLTLVGISIFLTEKRDGGVIEGSLFGQTSAHGLTLSRNLIESDYHFFMYSERVIDNGKILFDAYNRFPVFPFLLTGLVIHPFDANGNLKIYAARQLMNLFFFLSILIAYKLAKELLKDKFLALAVALISFSSYYMLTYNNMIFNDIPALLGFLVALYGILKAQKDKLKTHQILFFSILPISFGWQPFGVYITWFIIDSMESIFLNKKTTLKNKIRSIFKQKSFLISSIAIVWGIILLGLQLLNEWRIVGGSFLDLPSVYSAMWRSGLVSPEGHTQYLWTFDWIPFLTGQAHSIAINLIPFWPIFQVEPGINASIFIVFSFIIFILIRYIKNKTFDNKFSLILVFSGLVWTIPMRHFVALHDFQSIFYIGFAICFYMILFSKINLYSKSFLAVIVSLIFCLTVSLSNYYKPVNSGIKTEQFRRIQNLLPIDSKVYFDGNRHQLVGFSKFTVDYFLVRQLFTDLNNAEYVISENPNFNGEKLTSNSQYNLYKITAKTK